MDKKILTIIILAILLGGLLVFTFTRGKGVSGEDFDKIRAERGSLNATIVKLRGNLRKDQAGIRELEVLNVRANQRIETILDELSQSYQRTDGYLNEYGAINSDLRDFLNQAGKE